MEWKDFRTTLISSPEAPTAGGTAISTSAASSAGGGGASPPASVTPGAALARDIINQGLAHMERLTNGETVAGSDEVRGNERRLVVCCKL